VSEAKNDPFSLAEQPAHRYLLGLVMKDAVEKFEAEIIEALHLQRAFRPFTRCMTCNGGLVAIARGDVADLVPPRVYRRFRSFKQCKECRRVYWRGTHFVRLQRLVERYRQSPAATNAAQ
jgi:hypothetical protein